MAGELSLTQMWEYLDNRQVNTRLRKAELQNSTDLGRKKEDDAISFYVGSKKSDFFYRFYDKAKEQGDYEKKWIRIELINRSEYAIGAAEALLSARENIGEIVAAMIRASLVFVEADNNRVDRCTCADWWHNFLETVEKIKWLNKQPAKQEVEKLALWMESQLSRSLAVIRETMGSGYLMMICEEGKKVLKPHQIELIEDWQQNQRGSPGLS